ncbi:DUF4112 domain-containing protein [Neisseria weixii]|uniref:DUF4112 domain-containing protein n=1 Tax=Neisseria weixii TaxID=1853276 RepID=A0A3N4N2F0_9NEIS|nr:DUF4112 domain-containing protein [Neisseria weixii]RPD90644.1 DUF4112 domain-containing protein [Neisseria weixii]
MCSAKHSIWCLCISLFKTRSIPLTLVVIFNSLLDLLIGLIPVIGTALDFFHRLQTQFSTGRRLQPK